MNTIKYSRIKIAIGMAVAGLFVWAGLWVWDNFTGKGAFAMLMLALVMPFIMIYLLRYLVDNTVAEFGRSSMKFYGFFGMKRVDYSEIVDIAIETQSYTNAVGGSHLAFKTGEGLLGHPKISEWLLDGKHGKLDGVLDTFVAAREGRGGTPARRQGHAQAAAPQEPGVQPAQQPAGQQPGQRVRTFGRKSV